MDHHEACGSHQDGCARHRNDGRSRGRNAVDLDGDVAGIIHEHRVDLAGCDAVAAGAVQIDDHVALAGEQLILEHLRCDVIVKPALGSDGAVQFKNPCFRFSVGLISPLPKLLRIVHRVPIPPFPNRYLQKLRRGRAGAYCH